LLFLLLNSLALQLAKCWAFETTGILASGLGSIIALDAHYVLLNTTLITFFTFPFGLAIAASIRVGNLVGEGQVQTAKRATKIVGMMGAGFMAMSGMIIAAAREDVGRLFSEDEAVIRMVATIAPIGGLFQLVDGIQGTLGGALRGLGLQQYAALINLTGLWIFGVLIGYLFTYQLRLGLPGLWWGLACGLAMTALLNVLVLWKIDWKQQVVKAQERMRKDEEELKKKQQQARKKDPEATVHMYKRDGVLPTASMDGDTKGVQGIHGIDMNGMHYPSASRSSSPAAAAAAATAGSSSSSFHSDPTMLEMSSMTARA